MPTIPAVNTYVALLRGINVGGRSTVAMADLRSVVAGLGHQDVSTYIQSGNVIFGSSSDDTTALARELEKAIASELGRTVGVLLRTAAELDAIIEANPFLGREDDFTKLLVTFLADDPGTVGVDVLAAPPGETGELALIGREVYVHVPDGYGRSKLGNTFVEKKLGVVATTRNWKSVLKLRTLATP